MVYLLFVLGFPALVLGASWLVRGAGSLALSLGVGQLTVGLTIVAFGTSAPELIVSCLAAWRGQADLALGNVVGSNIANILLILGTASVIRPLTLHHSLRWREVPFALLAALVLAALAYNSPWSGRGGGFLGRGDGLALLGYLAIYLYYLFSMSAGNRPKEAAAGEKGEEDVEAVSVGRAVAYTLLGCALLALGGDWLVRGASSLALALGMSQAMIGLTIVSLGTSLPELATSIVAAARGQADISVGNVVGSNIFNVCGVMGTAALVSPLPASPSLAPDFWIMTGATILLFLFTFTGQKHRMDRWEGALCLVLYGAYLGFLIWRG